ncbi:hypothetical protein MHBO_000974 [Bonamia ostreae]|uniref:Uncharacterized protein n=1 Tax=Bonamia ostreae TaxID=126728 RepID=A0ABV2AHH1_9EUKA
MVLSMIMRTITIFAIIARAVIATIYFSSRYSLNNFGYAFFNDVLLNAYIYTTLLEISMFLTMFFPIDLVLRFLLAFLLPLAILMANIDPIMFLLKLWGTDHSKTDRTYTLILVLITIGIIVIGIIYAFYGEKEASVDLSEKTASFPESSESETETKTKTEISPKKKKHRRRKQTQSQIESGFSKVS